MEDLIDKHLSFHGKTDDKWWLQASVKHYLETGKISGSFHQAIESIMNEHNTSLHLKIIKLTIELNQLKITQP